MHSTKKITVMIQARLDSKRLPLKVLSRIEKKSMIWHVINRAKKIKKVEQIILITTRRKIDKPLVQIAKKSKILHFEGNTNDVLDRHYQCALKYNADPIIRITADCPLIDPELISQMLSFYLKHNYDYVANNIKPTYPDGLDCQIASFKALKVEWEKAQWKSEREHVMRYICNHPKKFKIFNYKNKINLSKYRWSVDEINDLKFVRKIYLSMRPRKIFSTNKVLQLIKKNPKLLEINKGIIRDEGYLISLRNDKKIKLVQD